MEDFYNDPFVNREKEDDLCFADILPPRNPEAPTAVAGDNNGNAAGSSESALGLSYALRFQSQLSEALRANSSLRATYDAHIQTQRQEIDRLGAENSKLISKLTGVETQLRSMVLEKDCAAMAYKREVDKNIALEEKVASLEAELNSVERRAKDLAATYYRTPRQKPQNQQKLSQTTPNRSNECLMQTPRSNQSKLDSSLEGRHNRSMQRPSVSQCGDASHQSQAQQSRIKGKNALEKRGDKVVDKATVQQLEKELMQQCLEKDEIERQLRKIENMRLRTVTERSRKMALERELEEAQSNVSELRMRLRLMSALVR